jgi:hypothetical protein
MQQQFLRKRGLAGVRMRDDREGTPGRAQGDGQIGFGGQDRPSVVGRGQARTLQARAVAA